MGSQASCFIHFIGLSVSAIEHLTGHVNRLIPGKGRKVYEQMNVKNM